MKIVRLKYLSLLSLTAALACGKPEHSHPPSSASNGSGSEGGSSTNPALEKSALQILSTNCASCHGTQGLGGVSNITDVTSLTNQRLIIRGQPDSSTLILSVEAGRMPVGGRLTAQEASTLRDWVKSLKGQAPATPTPVPTPGPTPRPTPVPTATPRPPISIPFPIPIPTATPRPNPTPVQTPTPTPMPGPNPTPVPPANPAANFQSISANILNPRCVSCHSSSNARGNVKLDTYANAFKQVRAGAPNSSPLYTASANGSMPVGGAKLTQAELKAISDWITAGAPNN